jgi:hypothetical protein
VLESDHQTPTIEAAGGTPSAAGLVLLEWQAEPHRGCASGVLRVCDDHRMEPWRGSSGRWARRRLGHGRY